MALTTVTVSLRVCTAHVIVHEYYEGSAKLIRTVVFTFTRTLTLINNAVTLIASLSSAAT